MPTKRGPHCKIFGTEAHRQCDKTNCPKRIRCIESYLKKQRVL